MQNLPMPIGELKALAAGLFPYSIMLPPIGIPPIPDIPPPVPMDILGSNPPAIGFNDADIGPGPLIGVLY